MAKCKYYLGVPLATILATILLILPGMLPADAAFSGSNGGVVFQRNGDIWLTSKFLLDPTKLTPNTPISVDVDPAVSRSGRKIAFTSNRDGDFEIFTLDVYSGTLTKVTRNGVRDAEPAWAPDGTRLVYESPTTTPGRSDTDLWVKNADGTGIATDVAPEPGDSRTPSWSPDGRKIAYGESGKVLVKTLSTGNIRPISNDPCFTSIKPNWSPDGSRLAFQANAGTGCSTADFEIFTARSSDGSDFRQITVNTTPDGDPAYSPEGSVIVYDNFASGNGDILIVDAGGAFLPEDFIVEPTDDGAPDWAATARPAAPGCTISGTFASDHIFADSLNNTICALGGNDRVFGDSGNDTLKGGTGRDQLTGGPGRDTLLGANGNDGLDSLDNVNGNDTLDGGPGTNLCIKDRREASVRNCP